MPAEAGIHLRAPRRAWIVTCETVDFLRDGVICSFVIPAQAGIQGWNVSSLVS
ncbi:MAG: hypothetical protein H6Q33_5270, partial [Deltaproteobacteria bacterium]|nr:hypothetical protein [Deltaproteobacteria bacterium]